MHLWNVHRRIRDELWDGFVHRNGATVSVAGESMLSKPYYALNFSWCESVVPNPHPKAVTDWLAGLPSSSLAGEADRSNFATAFLSNADSSPTSDFSDAFAALERAFGSWRDGASTLVLSVVVLVLSENEAQLWGHLLGQRFAYDLKHRRLVRIVGPGL